MASHQIKHHSRRCRNVLITGQITSGECLELPGVVSSLLVEGSGSLALGVITYLTSADLVLLAAALNRISYAESCPLSQCPHEGLALLP